MKKNIQYFAAAMLLLAMLLPTAITAGASPEEGSLEEEKITSTDNSDDVKNQKSFCNAMKFKEKYTTGNAKALYPENFGGIYIDDNNDLHILYVEDAEEFKKDMADDEILYDRVKYSYNSLFEIYETLGGKMKEFSITEVSVDESNNRVTVAAEEASRGAILRYLSSAIKQFDAESIAFTVPKQYEFTVG